MGIPAADFDNCWQRRNEIDFAGLLVVFISKKDLLAAEQASGRLHDLSDADLLSMTYTKT
jgi:hypothetical protein